MAYKDVNRKLPPKGLVPLGWFALIVGLWIPTYWVAYKLNFAPALNSLVDGLPVYIPGQALYWAMTWGELYPSMFLKAILVSAASFLVFAFLVRKSRAES